MAGGKKNKSDKDRKRKKESRESSVARQVIFLLKASNKSSCVYEKTGNHWVDTTQASYYIPIFKSGYLLPTPISYIFGPSS
jgi:hypothetical protein